MRNLLFLLLLTVSGYGQAVFDEGVQITGGQTTTSTTSKIISQESNGTLNTINAVNFPVSTATQTALDLKANRESGVILFDGLSINADPTKFNLGAGTGYITNSLTGVTTAVSWLAQTAQTTPYLATSVATYVLKDSSGATVLQNSYPTNEQFRTHIYLGKLAHTTFTTISVVVNDPSRSFSVAGDFHDFVNSIGSINIEGNAIAPNGANLQINVSAGMTYREGANFMTNRNSPNITNEPAVNATTFRNKFRNGSGGWSAVNTTTVDPNNYDNGSGILQVVPNNKFTIRVVYRFGGSGTIHMDYGQAVYDDMAAADAGIANSVASDPDTKGFASRIGWIIIKQGTTSLLDATKYKFVAADLFGVRAATSAPVATLQTSYDASVTPQIVTNPTGGAVAIRRGSAADSDNILVGQNGAGSTTFSFTGSGNLTSSSGAINYNNITGTNIFAPSRIQFSDNAYMAHQGATSGNIFKSTSTGWESGIAIRYASDLSSTYTSRSLVDKAYADGLVVGLLNDRGSYDASSNLFPSTGGSGTAGAILKGNLWAVSVAGTLGGVAVGIGDWIRALVDTPGQTASNWSVVEGNFGYVPENVSNKSDSYTVSSSTTYASTKAVVDGLATKQNTITNPVTGTGSSGMIPVFNSSSNIIDSSIRQTSSFVEVLTKPLRYINDLGDPVGFHGDHFRVFGSGSKSDLVTYVSGPGNKHETVIDGSIISTVTGSGVSVNGSLSATTYTGSATLTGTPTAPTATAGTNTTQIATTAFVQAATASLPKTWASTITQSGTSAPIVNVSYINQLSGSIVWARTGVGTYTGTLTGAFPSNKVFFMHSNSQTSGNIQVRVSRTSDDVITVETLVNAALSDGVLNITSLKIEVYP